MAKFKRILSFLKGSKKRKSVVIHDSRTMRNNEVPYEGLAGNGNRRFGTSTGRPIVGNGGHYEQFLYIDDVKNGGLKKRTLSVAPSVVSSSNYTQTDQELSDTLSHLRSESSKLNRNSSKPINPRINSVGTALSKTTLGRKNNKSFTLRQDPIEEEKIIVEVKDNNKEEIEIDEDELIKAVHEFDNERKRNSGLSPTSTTEQGTFILKEDKEDEDGNQSFIIKNVNDDIQTKKLSFIISSTTNGLEDVEEENLNNNSESYLLSTPNLNCDDDQEEENDVSIKVEGMENMKKDYLANVKDSVFDKNTNVKESLIQFQPPEFSITNEKVYNYRNNDIIKTIFKKIPHDKDKEEDSDDEGNLQNKRKVNFVINNNKGKTSETITKKLSTKSSDAVFINHTPKPILVSSPTLNKSSTINSLPGTTTIKDTTETKEHTVSNKPSIKRLNSTGTIPNSKSSDESLPHVSNRINEINETIKQNNCAYTSAVPSSSTRNIFFMPLPRPSQATLLDFGTSTKSSPSLVTKKSNLYNHTNHSLGNLPTTKESSSSSRRLPWGESLSTTKSKESLFSAPLKVSIPIVKSPKESPLGTSNSTKSNSHKLSSNPSSNTLFSHTSLYSSSKKEKTMPNFQATSTPYVMNRIDTQSTLTETSSNNSFISDIQKDDISRISKDQPYLLSPNISIEEDENDLIDCQSNSSNTSNNCEISFAYENLNKRLSRSREESLRNVKEYVKSLDENPDSNSLFSTPLAYRKRYEKYGSLRSRTSSSNSHQARNNSFSTINGSLKSSNALKSKHSTQSNNSDATEGSSLTEYSNSNFSEHNSSFSIKTNSTNRTAPTQNSIYSREYYLNAKKCNTNKPLPLPSVQKYKTGEDTKRKEKFNSDSTIVSSYNKRYNIQPSSTKQGKHQNTSSVSSASTLACSPLPGPRSLLNNSSNLNKLSLMTADGNYFDDLMKDLNNMSFNDLITKYEQRTK